MPRPRLYYDWLVLAVAAAAMVGTLPGRTQAAQALTVLASAVGPLLLAWRVERTGSYSAMFTILAAVIACTSVTALVVSMPEPRDAPLHSPSPAQ